MKKQHLNDEEIQQYVLSKRYSADAAHVLNCEDCQKKVNQYSLLFDRIKHMEEPAFDFPLVELVMEQLPEAKAEVSVWKDLSVFILTAGIFAVFIVAYFFAGMWIDLLTGIRPVVFALIILTVIGITLFVCVDMFRKYQSQLKSLNFY